MLRNSTAKPKVLVFIGFEPMKKVDNTNRSQPKMHWQQNALRNFPNKKPRQEAGLNMINRCIFIIYSPRNSPPTAVVNAS